MGKSDLPRAVLLIFVALLHLRPCWLAGQPTSAHSDCLSWVESASTMEESISGGDAHCYAVKLHAGELFEANIEQLGTDVQIDVFAAGGEHLLQIDTLSTTTGPERILLVAEREQTLQIEVHPVDETAATGKYQLTVPRLEMATPGDRVKAQAAALAVATGSLHRAGRESDLEQALVQLTRAASLWRSQEDGLGEATALLGLSRVEDELGRKREARGHLEAARDLFRAGGHETGEAFCAAWIGASYDELGDPVSAARELDQALAGFRRLDDRKGLALVLSLLGSVHNKKGDKKEPLGLYESSLALSRQIGDPHLQSKVLNDMGIALTQMDRPQEAIDRFAEALRLLEPLGDLRCQAWILTNTGVVFGNLGDPGQALSYYLRSLPIRHETGDRYGEALTLHNIAAVYTDTGDLQGAMDAFRRALTLWREVGDKRFESRTLLGLGKLYSILGESDRALAAYNQALPLTQATQDKEGTAMAWLNLGWEHTSRQDYVTAEQELARSRDLWREIGSPRREAAALMNLAELDLARGEAATAIEFARQALALRRQVKDRRGEALGLHTVGKCSAALGNLSEAIDSFTAALALRTATRDRSGEAATRFHLAKAQRQAGDLSKALDNIEAALQRVDDVRAQVLGAEAKASFLETKDGYYRFYIDLLLEQAHRKNDPGLVAAALEADEARRARGLRDALALADGEVRRDVPPDLWAAEREAEEKIARLDLLLRTLLGQGKEGERAAALERELNDGLEALSHIRARIAEQSPQYASLMQPPAVSARAIQALATDGSSLVLEVMLGEQRSFAWLISEEKVEVAELPAGREVEAAANALYEALLRSRDLLGRRSFEAEALRLADWLLRPFKESLGTKRLIVIADGALQRIPFGVLPDPSRGDGTYQPLVIRREVIGLPSVSVLELLRRRPPAFPGERTAAVIADPVVDRTDPRLRNKEGTLDRVVASGSGAQPKATDSTFLRAIEDLGAESLVRLPFSAREAAFISSLLPRQSVLRVTGFAAQRELVTSGRLQGYRILHFATHGLLNTRHPELSGLVLSLFDEHGREQDGFLRVHEIYNLDLPADLVVLSACRTALGKDVKGEGLIGLTRAFFYAGAAGVVSSLWKVDDRATAELMQRFYRKLLKEKLPPAAALREAQLSMWRDPAWQAPYYWAGFIFQGDWQR